MDPQSIFMKLGDSLFPTKFTDYLNNRSVVLWGIEIVLEERRFAASFGEINESDLSILNGSFISARAGYKVHARGNFPNLSQNADILLLSKSVMSTEKELTAILIHELCHWYIDSGLQESRPIRLSDTDRKMARPLFVRAGGELGQYTPHTLEFCGVLCAASKTLANSSDLFESTESVLQEAMKYDLYE